MSSAMNSSPKPSRHSRRALKRSAVPAFEPSDQIADASQNQALHSPNTQTRKILRKGQRDGVNEIAALLIPDSRTPKTPSQHNSMITSTTGTQRKEDNLRTDVLGQKRKTAGNSHKKLSASISTKTALNGTAGTPHNTPSRSIETPERAYAGSAFYSSPAASSLPIPKFFSKSVLNVDKTAGLKAALDESYPESMSESEGSPCRNRKSPQYLARENSPLDVFFRAGKEATYDAENFSKQSGTTDYKGRLEPVMHAQDSPPQGVFPLEMDGTGAKITHRTSPRDYCKVPSSPSQASKKLFSGGKELNQEQENRKAQTVALKQLLHSPRLQVAPDTSAKPASSKFRQELQLPKSSGNLRPQDHSETFLPQHVSSKADACANDQGNPTSALDSPDALSPPSQNSEPTSVRQSINSKSIEDDLRRILKLDVLGGDIS